MSRRLDDLPAAADYWPGALFPGRPAGCGHGGRYGGGDHSGPWTPASGAAAAPSKGAMLAAARQRMWAPSSVAIIREASSVAHGVVIPASVSLATISLIQPVKATSAIDRKSTR